MRGDINSAPWPQETYSRRNDNPDVGCDAVQRSPRIQQMHAETEKLLNSAMCELQNIECTLFGMSPNPLDPKDRTGHPEEDVPVRDGAERLHKFALALAQRLATIRERL